jgi:hypothetical protein
MSVCLIAAGEAGCKGEREKEDSLVELGIIAHFKTSLLKETLCNAFIMKNTA